MSTIKKEIAAMTIGESITISYDKAPITFTLAIIVSAAIGIGLAAALAAIFGW